MAQDSGREMTMKPAQDVAAILARLGVEASVSATLPCSTSA